MSNFQLQTTTAMRSYSIAFSNNASYRIGRHVIFWLVWYLFFVITYSYQPGNKIIGYPLFLAYTAVKMLVYIPVHMLFCYIIIYLILPYYFLRNRYGSGICLLILSLFATVCVSYFLSEQLVLPLQGLFRLPLTRPPAFLAAVTVGISSFVITAGFALVFKLLKLWFIKEQEYEILKNKKHQFEIKFINTYIQPNFLPIMLKKIHSFSIASSPLVPEMLQKIESIVYYMVNDCNRQHVWLDAEIESIKDYLQLEKLTTNKLEIHYEIDGDTTKQKISPFILFPLVENHFRQISDQISDPHWVKFNLQIRNQHLTLEMSNNKPVETSNLFSYETNTVKLMKKRLELLYPGSHELKVIIHPETFLIMLELDLKEVVK